MLKSPQPPQHEDKANDDVLPSFLTNGLIDVGGDDARLERLWATASDLAVSLKKTPSKALAYALVAFDLRLPQMIRSIGLVLHL